MRGREPVYWGQADSVGVDFQWTFREIIGRHSL